MAHRERMHSIEACLQSTKSCTRDIAFILTGSLFGMSETPTVDEMKEKGFWYWNFHREGECHQKNKKEKDDISGLGS